MKEREAAPAERGSRGEPARAPRVSEPRTVPMPPGVRARLGESLRLGKSGDGAERQADAAAGDGRALAAPVAPSMESDAPIAGDVADELERPGAPLPAAARRRWERKLGADLGAVRVHDDGAARASAERIEASAYTHGDHVVLGDGAGPGTVGHELAHVVQQRAAGGPAVVQRNERARREAQRMYDKHSIGATPEAGNPIWLFEDEMAKDLTGKARDGDYALLHEAFDNVIMFSNDDDIAYKIAQQLSDEEMNELAARASGRLLLQKLWAEMDAGPTDSADEVQMQRIQTALSTSVTTPLTIIDDKGAVTPVAGKDDHADRPWLQPDRIKDKNQVRVREDGTPTNNAGKVLRKGEPGWDQMVATAQWTITVPLAPLSNLRLLSLARFAQWMFGNEPETIVGPDGVPKLGRRLAEVRDEMVRRIKQRAADKKTAETGPVVQMPDREPDPVGYRPPGAPNPLEQIDRIRNLGGFGSLTMVIAIFATDDVNYAITLGEGVDTVANMAMLAAARRRATALKTAYMQGGGGSGKPNSFARGGVFGTESFPVGSQRPGGAGGQQGVPSIETVVQQLKNNRSSGYGGPMPQYEITPEGYIRPKVNLPSALDLFGNKGGQPTVIRLDNGTVIPFDQPSGLTGPWMTPKLDPKFFPTLGGGGTGAPAEKPMKPSVFVQLVSTPEGKVMDTETLINGMYENHPNRKAIESSLSALNVVVESSSTLAKDRGASADVVMVEVVGPGGERFTRSRIRFQPGEATNQAFHHELNHLLDFQTGKLPRWERHITDPAQFEKARSMSIDALLALPAPKSSLNVAQSIARYNIAEIRNHLRDIDEYGMTAKGGQTVPREPTNFAERQRDPTIQNYTSGIRQLMRSSQLNAEQRTELGAYIRTYIDGAFPELPAEYNRLHHGKGNLWSSIGVTDK